MALLDFLGQNFLEGEGREEGQEEKEEKDKHKGKRKEQKNNLCAKFFLEPAETFITMEKKANTFCSFFLVAHTNMLNSTRGWDQRRRLRENLLPVPAPALPLPPPSLSNSASAGRGRRKRVVRMPSPGEDPSDEGGGSQ